MQEEHPYHGTAASLHLLGTSSTVPEAHLNLAGAQGVPTPDEIARPSSPPATNAPTFSLPDMTVPPLSTRDLTEPAVDHMPALTLDPTLPTLLPDDRPDGLDIYSGMSTVITMPDPIMSFDIPQNGQREIHTLLQPDPLLPDLQHPDLELPVHMQDRPGELDASALHVLHLDATYQQLADKSYPDVFMDQKEANTTRVRRQSLLIQGLTDEERA